MPVLNADLTGAGEPARLFTGVVSPAFFDVFGVRPALGRSFRPDESVVGQHRVVILGTGCGGSGSARIPGSWAERSSSTRSLTRSWVCCQTPSSLRMPSSSSGRAGADRRTAGAHRTLHYLQVYGRLKTDVTLDAARADMDRIGAQLAEEYPDSNQDHGAHVVTLRERLQEPVRSGLFTLLAAVAFVLLIGCVNVANLLLARAASRRREMAIRSAIGAGRSRIAGQALTESAVLALLGGVATLVVAHWGIALLRQLAPGDLEVLGADRVQRLVLKEGLAQAGLGLALGLTAAVLVMHGFRSMLYQVSPADRSRWPRWPSCCSPPPSWHASSRPGRAMRVDPIQALRSKTRTAESTATFRPTS